jgi:diphthine synthase
MLYIIGLGLNKEGISKEGLSAIEKCANVYLEGYTVDFPYNVSELEPVVGKKIITLKREDVEGDKLVKEAGKEDICLLVYGSPLFATTHTSLIMDANKAGIETKIIYNVSIFDAVAETGLQLYKFGKITSMPAWKKNFTPDSFLDIVKENQKIKAHSLILTDIGLNLKDALSQLEISLKNKKMKIEKIIVCSQMGTKDKKIFYDTLENLKKKDVKMPFCLILPSEMHFLEKEALEASKSTR